MKISRGMIDKLLTEFVKYDNKKIINFYIENVLEFDERKSYFGTNVKSFVLLENEKLLVYKDKSFIEVLAVDRKYRNKGYGKVLIEKAIEKLEKPIYTISKVDEIYFKNGFIYDNADLIGKECKTCEEYNVTCFPKVVIYK